MDLRCRDDDRGSRNAGYLIHRLAASFSWQFYRNPWGQHTDFKDQKRSATGNEPILITNPLTTKPVAGWMFGTLALPAPTRISPAATTEQKQH
jgi:hypothetical protein